MNHQTSSDPAEPPADAQDPLAAPVGDDDEGGFYIGESRIKGGEECAGCGMTPGVNPDSEMPGTLMIGTSQEPFELCEDCSALVAQFFILGHLNFLKNKTKFPNWIFAENPLMPRGE